MEQLEHNKSKNVSKGPPFLLQTQFQTLEYGLNDTIWIIMKEVISIFPPPSDKSDNNVIFQTIFMPKVIYSKILSLKSWSYGTIFILNML